MAIDKFTPANLKATRPGMDEGARLIPRIDAMDVAVVDGHASLTFNGSLPHPVCAIGASEKTAVGECQRTVIRFLDDDISVYLGIRKPRP